MKTFKFKTSIKCDGCIDTIKPYLNYKSKIKEWEVDMANPDKVLTITTDFSEKDIVNMLKNIGYSAEKL